MDEWPQQTKAGKLCCVRVQMSACVGVCVCVSLFNWFPVVCTYIEVYV